MTRLDDCGDVLTLRQLCAVLQISERDGRRRRQHGVFPIPELPHLPKRFSKAAVERYLTAESLRVVRKRA